jgi:hypothetical protein
MVAAGLAGVLLIHHAIHRPIAYGWLGAGALLLALVAVGGYARVQRGRALTLRAPLTTVERESAVGERPRGHLPAEDEEGADWSDG